MCSVQEGGGAVAADDQSNADDERAARRRLRLHGLWAMLLAPLSIALGVLAFFLLVLWLPDVIPYPTDFMVLGVIKAVFTLGAIPVVVIFIAGVIQLITGKPLGLVESLYKRKSKE
jgi:uncharacterized RDD family membrane protein YckC